MDPQNLSFLFSGASDPCQLVHFSPSGPCMQRSLRSLPWWAVSTTAPWIGVWQWLLAWLPVAWADPGESTLLLLLLVLCSFRRCSVASSLVPSFVAVCTLVPSFFRCPPGVLCYWCASGCLCSGPWPGQTPGGSALSRRLCVVLAVVLGTARSGTLCTCVLLRTRAV